MAKFKVGDRVRCVDSEGTTCVVFGGEYEVESCGSQFVNLIGVRGGMYAYRFALVPTITIETGKHYRLRNGKVTGRISQGDIGFEALVDGQVKVFDKASGHVFGNGEMDIVEAWVPKVGERVYVVYGHGWNGEGEVKDIAYQTFVIILKSGSRAGSSGGFTLQDLEPLLVAAPAQPAVLTIQPGRYYKTRDGRKVGPIGPNEGGLAEYPWQDNSDWTDCWTTDGRFYNDGTESQHDIVAEWIDEPAVTASNDNVAKPKFKVGDRVLSLITEVDVVAGKIYEIVEIDDDGDIRVLDDTGNPWLLADGEFELVAESLETLNLTVTADTEAVEAAFDRIIAKLERIAELQAELGLRAA